MFETVFQQFFSAPMCDLVEGFSNQEASIGLKDIGPASQQFFHHRVVVSLRVVSPQG